MNFKEYLVSDRIAKDHKERYEAPMKWYHLPGVGKYNSFELKFHSDWNWLCSACIEFKKYYDTNPDQTRLKYLYDKLLHVKLVDLDLHRVWVMVSDYAIEVNKLIADGKK